MTKIVPENNFCGLAESNQIYKFDRDDQKKLDLFILIGQNFTIIKKILIIFMP